MNVKLLIGTFIVSSALIQATHIVQFCPDKKSVESVFDQAKKTSKLVVIDFFAEWCGPCKMMAPVFERLAGDLKEQCIFAKIDVDQCRTVAQEYRVQAMPTIVIIRDGKEVGRIIGSKSYTALKDEIKQYIK